MCYIPNQFVLFNDSNTWYYIKKEHTNISKNELTDLLGDDDVSIILSLR